MCGIFLLQFTFLCAIFNVYGLNIKNELEVGLKEQSMLYGIAIESNNFTNCGQDLKKFVIGIGRREKWALNMLDSSGQEEVSYLFANFLWMGSMSQCKNINLDLYTDNNFSHLLYKVDFMTALFKHNNTLQGQYRSPNNDNLQIDLCLPKSCATEDISPIINRIIAKRQLTFLQNYPVELSLLKIKSLSDENNNWMNHPIVIFTLFSLLITIGLTILGSCYDMYLGSVYSENSINNKDKDNEKPPLRKKIFGEDTWWSQVLLCYSFPNNVRSLFDTNVKSEESLPVVHGLKTIGMFYIVAVHFPLYLSTAMDNIGMLLRYSDFWSMQIITKSVHSVDTYFFLGGFLISFAFYKTSKTKKPYGVLEGIGMFCKMILHRVIRLYPSYIVSIGLVVTIWRYVGMAYPLYQILDLADEICPTYWWRNLLFITTWYPRTEMCLTWTWYLSNDIQFYVLNCALLVLSTKFPIKVLIFLKLLIAYSIIRTGWLTYTMSYIHTLDDIMLNELMYYSFSVRMTSYFVGVLAGYYFNKSNGRIPLSDKAYRVGWIICLVTFLYVVHGLQYPNYYSQAYIIFYVSLSKFLWGSCVAWILLACLSGHGGIINKFLSLKCWVPLSRVTFGVYLTNVIVIYMYAYTGEKSVHFAIADQFSFMYGSIAICFLFGTLFSLLFESPFLKLIKLLMKSEKKNIKTVERNIEGTNKKCS